MVHVVVLLLVCTIAVISAGRISVIVKNPHNLQKTVASDAFSPQPSTCYERIPPPKSDDPPVVCADVNNVVIDTLGHVQFTNRQKPIKIIDTFIFNGEFDMLDIRLMTLWDVVDHFVIAESRTSFSGKPKKLHFYDHREKYVKLASKIHHYIYEFTGNETFSWIRERDARDGLWDQKKALRGLTISDGDVIMMADLDEMVETRYLQVMKACQGFPAHVGFHLKFYYYSFEYRKIRTVWNKPRALTFNSSILPLPSAETSRMSKHIIGVHNGGWHCSYCFNHLEDFVNKIHTFSHTELDEPDNVKTENILFAIKHGIDLFQRGGEQIVHEKHIYKPAFVRAHLDCFSYLIHRKDWVEVVNSTAVSNNH